MGELNQQQINPHMVSMPGFEPGRYWWEASDLTTLLLLLYK